jgi:hypothetical protein
VKYRALLAAELGHADTRKVKAYLVAYNIPLRISVMARNRGVKTAVIPESRVKARAAKK